MLSTWLSLGLLAAPAAGGAPAVAVAVVALDAQAAQAAGALELAAEAALVRAGRFAVVPAPEAFEPGAAGRRAARLEAGRARARDGRALLDGLDPAGAAAALTEAAAALAEADWAQGHAELLGALVQRASAHAMGGQLPLARAELEALLAADPRVALPPALFPAELLRFAEARRRLAAQAEGVLQVRTEPPGARVWVDGVDRGPAPVTVSGLAAGLHRVRAGLGGLALAQVELAPGEALVTLAPGETAAAWTQARRLVVGNPSGPGLEEAGRTLARAAGVEQLVLVVARASPVGQLELTALRLEAGVGHPLASREATVPAEGLPAFFDALAADAPRAGGATGTPPGGGGPLPLASPILFGTSAAALGAGGVLGFLASQEAAAWRTTRQTSPDSPGIRARGQTYAVVADVSFIVGLAAAATGAVLALLPPAPPPPEPVPVAQRRDEELPVAAPEAVPPPGAAPAEGPAPASPATPAPAPAAASAPAPAVAPAEASSPPPPPAPKKKGKAAPAPAKKRRGAQKPAAPATPAPGPATAPAPAP